MATEIKFGTSGWRAIVAEEFTLGNIRRAVTGIATYVASRPGSHRVLVGRDPRFMGEMFVDEAARLLAQHGVTPVVIPEAAPTPAIAYAIREQKASGGINFTASHNPPEYNGIKFSTPDGAPALPETTQQIEAAIRALGDAPVAQAKPLEHPQTLDVKTHYLKRLGELVDFKTIQAAKIKIVFDPFWGAARGYTSDILRDHGIDVSCVHDYRDVLFGGHAPEPDDHLLGDARRARRSASRPTAMPTGSALSMRTGHSSSRTT
jgi:phosphomannomutase